MEMNKEIFCPVIEESVMLNSLEDPIILFFLTEKGRQTIQTCPGDIYKIVNALMDYARILELAVRQWDLCGFHKATYELRAEQLRKLARKYAGGIGYDYEKALQKCKKRQERRQRAGNDIGEDVLVLAIREVKQEEKHD